MVRLKRLVLDVLKPHRPECLEFTRAIAACGTGWRVRYSLEEIDENTESVIIVIEGADIQFEPIARAIETAGGSIHSIDEVEMHGEPDGD